MATNPAHILIIDDDESFRQMVATFIKKCLPTVKTTTYDPVQKGLPAPDFNWDPYDLLILDYQLGHHDTGLDVLQSHKKNRKFPATIMLTGEGNEKIAVLAMKHGAEDYITKKGLSKTHLRDSISDALEKHEQKIIAQEKADKTGQPFDKPQFYAKFENYLSTENNDKKSLLMIELDDFQSLEESRGYIIPDNIILRIAQDIFHIFNSDTFNPIITRFSDTSLALLIDNSHEDKILISKINKLFKYLSNNPFLLKGDPIHFTVSIGIVLISNKNTSAESIIKCSRHACQSAAEILGNSYYIYARKETIKEIKEETLKQSINEDTETSESSPEIKSASKTKIKSNDKQKKTNAKPIVEKKVKKFKINIKQAISENRVMQYYQPIMPLSDAENRENTELFEVCPRMINIDGSFIEPENIKIGLQEKNNQKILDRWMLRRIVSRLVRAKEYTDANYMLFVTISEESLTDTSFFNWVKKLMNLVSKHKLGKSIVMGFTIETLIKRRKQAEALINYLRKTYEFKFYLSATDKIESIKKYNKKIGFNYIKLPHNLIRSISGVNIKDQTLDGETGINLNEQTLDGEKNFISSSETPLIADRVENSSILTQVISTGADFALGQFIGEPQEQLTEMLNLEFFEIT